MGAGAGCSPRLCRTVSAWILLTTPVSGAGSCVHAAATSGESPLPCGAESARSYHARPHARWRRTGDTVRTCDSRKGSFVLGGGLVVSVTESAVLRRLSQQRERLVDDACRAAGYP